ncbi:protein translocase subunit SecD [Candidatus Collierbacteria bacterium]|nr:protein translocase subunit SecD [Candidatus Collierbacteria bacterium]
MRKQKLFGRSLLIAVISILSLYISLPRKIPVNLEIGKWRIEKTFSLPGIEWQLGPLSFRRDLEIKQGLDLKGGTQIVLEAQVQDLPEVEKTVALESAKTVIARRIDLYGISESVVQTAKNNQSYRLIVELPGVTDADEAKSLIGQTAKLEFWEMPQTAGPESSPSQAQLQPQPQPTNLTGKDLQKASVEFDRQTGQPVVSLVFTDEGREKFAEITKRNVGQRVGIYLDGAPLTVPVVQVPITDGRAIISGNMGIKEAKQLAISLNAGALPVGMTVVKETNIGATLGKESIAASVRAGLAGLLAVAAFMIIVYRKLGILADVALIIYGLITLTIYKLFPITLTLPGIAGFLLSIGMATDANILIFERLKEESARGLPLRAAVELGFGRAWDSIKDANVTTLLVAFILYNPFEWQFLNTSGMVRGFALTLTIGILISLFTGIVVSRTLIRTFYINNKK